MGFLIKFIKYKLELKRKKYMVMKEKKPT